MKESDNDRPVARSWRDIPQRVSARAMSSTGRSRVLIGSLRTALFCILGLAAAWACWETGRLAVGRPAVIAPNPGVKTVARYELRTDGVLDREWLVRTLGIRASDTLVSLDLDTLQSRLLAHGQVLSATVAKRFPDGLAVTLVERTPVARVRTEAGVDLLVARDGTIYRGQGYDPGLVESLPGLQLDRIVRRGGGYAPVRHMELVADLLGRARMVVPELHDTWRVVDLTRIEADGEIVVRSTLIPTIVFGVRTDFFTQLARLDYALDRFASPPASVNLSIGSQAIVTYDKGVPAPRMHPAGASPAAGARQGPILQAFPDFNAKPTPARAP